MPADEVEVIIDDTITSDPKDPSNDSPVADPVRRGSSQDLMEAMFLHFRASLLRLSSSRLYSTGEYIPFAG